MVISIYCECPVSMFLILGYEEKNRWTTLVIKISVDSKDISGERNKLLPRTYKFSDLGSRSTRSVCTKSCRIVLETAIQA